MSLDKMLINPGIVQFVAAPRARRCLICMELIGLLPLSQTSLNASCTTPTDLQFQPQHSSTPTRASQQDKWKERPLRVLNVQSASAKRAKIPNLLHSLKPDVILDTETWLDPSISSSEILPSLYNVYWRDRGGKGGGVLIAVCNTLVSSAAPELEVLWVRVKLKGRRTLYLCA